MGGTVAGVRFNNFVRNGLNLMGVNPFWVEVVTGLILLIAVLLSGAVPIDLSAAAFPVGMCTRPLCEKAEIVLWRRGAVAWPIEAGRAFAPLFRDLLGVLVAATRIPLTLRRQGPGPDRRERRPRV